MASFPRRPFPFSSRVHEILYVVSSYERMAHINTYMCTTYGNSWHFEFSCSTSQCGLDLLAHKAQYFGHATKPRILMCVQNMAPYNYSTHINLFKGIIPMGIGKTYSYFGVLLSNLMRVMTVSNIWCDLDVVLFLRK